MFEISDLILYGNTGVCRVTGIGTKDLPGAVKGQLYYTLSPLYQSGIIYTPVDNRKVFMRPIISRDEAERLIELIPTVRAEAYHSRVLSELVAHYEKSLRSYDCGDLIELTKSLYEKKQALMREKRKLGAVDERFMRRAEELLFGELGAALDMPKEEVPDYIASKLGE